MLSNLTLSPVVISTNRDYILDITGSGFLVTTVVTLISPIVPPVIYPTSAPQLLSGTEFKVTVPAGSVPTGIYDVKIDNGGTDVVTLEQSIRVQPPLPVSPFTDQTANRIQINQIARLGTTPDGKPWDARQGQTVWWFLRPAAVMFERFYKRLWAMLLQGFAQFMEGALLELRAEENGVLKKASTYATTPVETVAAVGSIIPIGPPPLRFSTTTVASDNKTPVTFISTETVQKIQKSAVIANVTASDNTSVTCSTLALVLNEWVDGFIQVTLGRGIGQVRRIVSNTATQIVCDLPWDPDNNPDVTSQVRLFSGVEARAEIAGVLGNIAANSINKLLTPVPFITSVKNPISAVGGVDRENDASFLARYLLEVRKKSSGGNFGDYERWARETPGTNLGQVSVIDLWNGPGTGKIVIINADNSIPTAAVVATVAAYIETKRPINHIITVQAATPVQIDVSIAITAAAGCNAANVRNQVLAAIQNYLNNLPTSQPVLVTQIIDAIINSDNDANGNPMKNTCLFDFDIFTSGHGIKKATDSVYADANIVLAGTEKAIPNLITVV